MAAWLEDFSTIYLYVAGKGSEKHEDSYYL